MVTQTTIMDKPTLRNQNNHMSTTIQVHNWGTCLSQFLHALHSNSCASRLVPALYAEYPVVIIFHSANCVWIVIKIGIYKFRVRMCTWYRFCPKWRIQLMAKLLIPSFLFPWLWILCVIAYIFMLVFCYSPASSQLTLCHSVLSFVYVRIFPAHNFRVAFVRP